MSSPVTPAAAAPQPMTMSGEEGPREPSRGTLSHRSGRSSAPRCSKSGCCLATAVMAASVVPARADGDDLAALCECCCECCMEIATHDPRLASECCEGCCAVFLHCPAACTCVLASAALAVYMQPPAQQRMLADGTPAPRGFLEGCLPSRMVDLRALPHHRDHPEWIGERQQRRYAIEVEGRRAAIAGGVLDFKECPTDQQVFGASQCMVCMGDFKVNPGCEDLRNVRQFYQVLSKNPNLLSRAGDNPRMLAEFETDKLQPGCFACGHMVCAICAEQMRQSNLRCHCLGQDGASGLGGLIRRRTRTAPPSREDAWQWYAITDGRILEERQRPEDCGISAAAPAPQA